MANLSRAVLESALRAMKLDTTIASAPSAERSAVAATGLPPLDAALRGGLPRGQLSEIVGRASCGRTTVLQQTIAAATARGDIAALIDTFDRFDVASAVAAGIDLDRLLWVRGADRAGGWVEQAIDRALKALNLVLQAGEFGVVALDLSDLAPLALKRILFTTWLRVQRVIEGSETACVLLASQPLARSAGGVTLVVGPSPTRESRGRVARWTGSSDRSRRLAGLDIAVRVVSPRQRVGGTVEVAARTALALDPRNLNTERRI